MLITTTTLWIFFNYPNVLSVGNLCVSKCIRFIIIIYIFSSIFDLMCLLSGEMQRQEDKKNEEEWKNETRRSWF